ncbi:SH3 domain-containing protein [Paraglaciecola polaris]|uniref:SH3 domain-containing protein n=1 Tax=Paraglaciecola polaris TaxID=222814 RepID=UPI003C6E6F61
MKQFLFMAWLTISTLCLAAWPAMAQQKEWGSDVMHISQAQLHAEHWMNKLKNPEQVVMSDVQIRAHNHSLLEHNRFVHDPLLTPEVLTDKQLKAKINSISKVPKSARFFLDGRKLAADDYAVYQQSMQFSAAEQGHRVTYGLIVKRAAMRTFPTDDRVLNSAMDADLDRFQESALFPGDTVAVLTRSQDKQWALVQGFNYLAWTRVENFAVASKEQVQAFASANDFIVVTGAKVFTQYVPEHIGVSEQQLDMSVRLPLVAKNEVPNALYGQNPYANYVVWLPTRTAQGQLSLQKALIGRSQDVHLGYMPFTKENVIKQGFKFLGERYGWGHDYNGRDCTGFVGEIYRAFGLLMPRNSGDQGGTDFGIDTRFNKGTPVAEKLASIKSLEVGDLLYIPGHVMLYLGAEDGQPFVIHDVKGLAYFDDKQKLYKGTLNGVSVTPLLPLRLSVQNSYVDRLYNIKRIR